MGVGLPESRKPQGVRGLTIPCMQSGASCSFCGKSVDEVKKMVAGPAVFICNECIMLCVDILEEQAPLEEWRSELLRGYRLIEERPGRKIFVPNPDSQILVRFPDGTVHSCEQESTWRPLLHGGTSYEWCRARGLVRSPTPVLVVAVREAGESGSIRGAAFPADARVFEEHAKRILDGVTAE